MLSYEDLCRHPAAFPDLTGLRHAEFDALAVRFERAERGLRSASQSTRQPARAFSKQGRRASRTTSLRKVNELRSEALRLCHQRTDGRAVMPDVEGDCAWRDRQSKRR